MERVWAWVAENRDWVFNGIGAVLVISLLGALWKRLFSRATSAQQVQSGQVSGNVQAGRDINISLGIAAPTPGRSPDVFDELERSMGDFFEAIREELKRDPFVREFFVLPSRSVGLGGSSHPRFRFNADEIPDLIGKVHILEGHGFVWDVTPKNTPIYRMSEEFVRRLIESRA